MNPICDECGVDFYSHEAVSPECDGDAALREIVENQNQEEN